MLSRLARSSVVLEAGGLRQSLSVDEPVEGGMAVDGMTVGDTIVADPEGGCSVGVGRVSVEGSPMGGGPVGGCAVGGGPVGGSPVGGCAVGGGPVGGRPVGGCAVGGGPVGGGPVGGCAVGGGPVGGGPVGGGAVGGGPAGGGAVGGGAVGGGPVGGGAVGGGPVGGGLEGGGAVGGVSISISSWPLNVLTVFSTGQFSFGVVSSAELEVLCDTRHVFKQGALLEPCRVAAGPCAVVERTALDLLRVTCSTCSAALCLYKVDNFYIIHNYAYIYIYVYATLTAKTLCFK